MQEYGVLPAGLQRLVRWASSIDVALSKAGSRARSVEKNGG